MSKRGISNLLTTMMAVGVVERLDARDHRLAHAALRRLGQTVSGAEVLATFEVSRTWRPDPEVGLRVPGVTGALWDAVTSGALQVVEDGPRAGFVLAPSREAEARRLLSRLPAEQASEIYRVATDWAAASTSRKTGASTLTASASGTRRSKRA